MKLWSLKSGQILCAHKPYFLMPGHIYSYRVCICSSEGNMAILLKIQVKVVFVTLENQKDQHAYVLIEQPVTYNLSAWL